jgi:coenzyme F420-reducing hydrogenase gamma subunit
MRGTTCLLVTDGDVCLGPVTRAGCNALCPSIGRGCFGCFGPAETTNVPSLARYLQVRGMKEVDLLRLLRTFNANAPAFLDVSRQLAEEDRHG